MNVAILTARQNIKCAIFDTYIAGTNSLSCGKTTTSNYSTSYSLQEAYAQNHEASAKLDSYNVVQARRLQGRVQTFYSTK